MNVDGALLRFMGATSAEGTASEDVNALSLVVEVCLGGVAILVPGDAEAQYLEAMELNAVDVLAVAHHGSKGAVSDELLQELRLGLAVISVGRDNRFGHPHAETMLSLDRAHIQNCNGKNIPQRQRGVTIYELRADQRILKDAGKL